jgi:hypothetical protein
MKLDYLLAGLAFAMLAGFLLTIASFVPDPDLIVVIVVCLGCAGYDFWRTFTRDRKRR